MWMSGKSTLVCPVCRNGIDMDRIIPLYAGENTEKDSRPKPERIDPTVNRNRQSYVITFFI
jgi:hypothetical protein